MDETRETPAREPLWNVVVPVISLLRAPDGPAARDRLARALEMTGFEIYDVPDDPDGCIFTRPFESEDGPEEHVLPGEGRRPWGR